MAARRAPRRAVALALAGVALVLTACQTPPAPAADGAACAEPGDASSRVEADGELFAVPTVTFAPGIAADTTQRSVLVEGDGSMIATGDLVTLDYVAYNARTGDLLEQTGYGAPGLSRTQLVLDAATTTPGLRRALVCATQGSRIAAVMPADEAVAFPERTAGVAATDSVVFVIDVVSVAEDRATGGVVAPQEGLPTVTPRDDGQPEITIAAGAPAPPELRVALLRQGDGPAVRESSTVTVKYRGVLWRSGITFDDNWHSPLRDTRATHEFLPGFSAAVVGQAVGSQVLAVIPPELGFGPQGDPSNAITGTDTLVYVIDILATT